MSAKQVLVLWEVDKLERAERGRRVLTELGPALLEGTDRLTICVADEHARIPSPSPFPLGGTRPVALIDLWPTGDPLDAVKRCQEVGFAVHAWPAEESIPSDYGDNAHAPVRDWPDGQRSPGISVVSLLPRPARLGREEWVRRWHGVMSPVSGAIQPRTRYVRNLLGPPLTEGAPDFEGAVNECWPSPAHVTDPWLFYGADSWPQRLRNQAAIVRAVTHCFPLHRIPAVPMSEWILRS